MAELNTSSKGKGGKKGKKSAPRVDLTPLVDLAFLLITFFMLATSMIKPQTMEIAMPAKDDMLTEEEKTKVKASLALTLILEEEDQVYYYFGTRVDDVDPELHQTTFDPEGLRQLLLGRNALVVNQILEVKQQWKNKELDDETYNMRKSAIKDDPTAPVVVIKPTERCTYMNLVDALDEMNICSISKYAIVDLDYLDTVLMSKEMPQVYGTPSN